MTDRTNNQRQAAFKKRRREAGQVQVTVWVHSSNKERLRAIADELLKPDSRGD